MAFIDHAKIYIKAGNGGDGCAAFHREKYVPKGGPSGGDGGKGGSIIFVADPQESTLIAFKRAVHFRAENGEAGRAELQHGKDGKDLYIRVPVGTVVRDIETGAIVADMSEAGKERVVMRGGRGGKGNARFATPTHQSPRFAQNGIKTEERQVELELKTIADVGIIGFPSVGKSTILSVLTSAKPKIAAYHFTTLSPNLGVAERHGRSFVLADIPGLIEGAAEGAGLGHDFLRHIERTRILVHVLDVSGSEMRDPLEDYDKINAELAGFSDALAALPQIVCCNKMDLPDAEENLARVKAALVSDAEEPSELARKSAIILPTSSSMFQFNSLILPIRPFCSRDPRSRRFPTSRSQSRSDNLRSRVRTVARNQNQISNPRAKFIEHDLRIPLGRSVDIGDGDGDQHFMSF